MPFLWVDIHDVFDRRRVLPDFTSIPHNSTQSQYQSGSSTSTSTRTRTAPFILHANPLYGVLLDSFFSLPPALFFPSPVPSHTFTPVLRNRSLLTGISLPTFTRRQRSRRHLQSFSQPIGSYFLVSSSLSDTRLERIGQKTRTAGRVEVLEYAPYFKVVYMQTRLGPQILLTLFPFLKD